MSIIEELKKDISVLKEKIFKIQEQCSHPDDAVDEKPGSSQDNLDPSNNSFWIDYECRLCEKRWTEDN